MPKYPSQYKIFDPFSEESYLKENEISKVFFPTLEDRGYFIRMKYPLKDLTGPVYNLLLGEDSFLKVTLENASPITKCYVSIGQLLINNMYINILGIDSNGFRNTDDISLVLSNKDHWLSEEDFEYTKTNWGNTHPVQVAVRYDKLLDSDGAKLGYMRAKTSNTIDRTKYCILGLNQVLWTNNPINVSSKLIFDYDQMDSSDVNAIYLRRDTPIGTMESPSRVNGGVVNSDGEILDDWYEDA